MTGKVIKASIFLRYTHPSVHITLRHVMMRLGGQKPGLTDCYSRPKAAVQVRSWSEEQEKGRAVHVGVRSHLYSCAVKGQHS